MQPIFTISVIFRKENNGDIVAVFPSLDAGPGEMTCYRHGGPHSGCSKRWYNTTTAAEPEEYADLLHEVRDIYGDFGSLPLVIRRWL